MFDLPATLRRIWRLFIQTQFLLGETPEWARIPLRRYLADRNHAAPSTDRITPSFTDDGAIHQFSRHGRCLEATGPATTYPLGEDTITLVHCSDTRDACWMNEGWYCLAVHPDRSATVIAFLPSLKG